MTVEHVEATAARLRRLRTEDPHSYVEEIATGIHARAVLLKQIYRLSAGAAATDLMHPMAASLDEQGLICEALEQIAAEIVAGAVVMREVVMTGIPKPAEDGE